MFDDAQPHPSTFGSPESDLRFGRMLAEVLHDWFEVMSRVAYQTHRACEFFVHNADHGPVASRAWRRTPEASNGSIDMEKLRECLRPMDPEQAAQVMHAVQAIQAMEAMLKKYRAQADEAEQAPW